MRKVQNHAINLGQLPSTDEVKVAGLAQYHGIAVENDPEMFSLVKNRGVVSQ